MTGLRVILATDFSAGALVACELVNTAPFPAQTAVRVLTVFDRYDKLEVLVPELVLATDEIAERTAAELNSQVDALRRTGLGLTQEALLGHPAQKIVADAEAYRADLIVISGRGRGPFATALLGSVAAGVIDHAPCAVLVVRVSTLTNVVLAHDGSDGASAARDFSIPLRLAP